MNKFYYLELRFILIIITSILIIIFDGKFSVFAQIKKYTSGSVDLLYCLCDKPYFFLNFVSEIFKEYKDIISENHALRQELLLKRSELLLLEQCQKENFKLRELKKYPLPCNARRIITRIISINTDPWNHQIVINKGINNGVYIGQPIITDEGIVGQVISVHEFSSRVLLIYDIHHALSVQIKRNNHRMILVGRGSSNMELYAECPINIDVCIGDMLITSGLDGCFPAGYPVAIVSSIIINKKQDYIIIQALPTVKFHNLRDALLIWQ